MYKFGIKTVTRSNNEIKHGAYVEEGRGKFKYNLIYPNKILCYIQTITS